MEERTRLLGTIGSWGTHVNPIYAVHDIGPIRRYLTTQSSFITGALLGAMIKVWAVLYENMSLSVKSMHFM